MRPELPRTPPGIRPSQGEAGRPGAPNGPAVETDPSGGFMPGG